MKNIISLKNYRDFGRVYNQRKSFADKYLVMYAADNLAACSRIGISVSKKVGNSTIKEYRDALSEGEGAAKKYLIYKKLENILGNSYENGICKDFDVIEMIDICKWMG